jgi:drug/metabolite transporter (DMT)-like permease
MNDATNRWQAAAAAPAAFLASRLPAPAHRWLMLATLLWAGNFIVGRALRDAVAPLDLTVWRWLIALAALLPFTLRGLLAQRVLLWRHRGYVLALGASGLAIPHVCIYAALRETPALNVVLLMIQAPLFVCIGAWLAFGQRPSAASGCGLVVALIGAVTVVTRGQPQQVVPLQAHAADLLMLPALLGAMAHMLLLARVPTGLSQGPLLTASVLAALLCLAPAAAWQGGIAWPAGTHAAAGVIYTGVLASALAFWAWNTGVAAVGPVRASRHMMLMPVYGAALSWPVLGEPVGPYQALGGALVVAGLRLARLTGVDAGRRALRAAALVVIGLALALVLSDGVQAMVHPTRLGRVSAPRREDQGAPAWRRRTVLRSIAPKSTSGPCRSRSAWPRCLQSCVHRC